MSRDIEIRQQAIANVAVSENAADVLYRYLNEEIGMTEMRTELDDLLDAEIGYLESEEYQREERRNRNIDDSMGEIA